MNGEMIEFIFSSICERNMIINSKEYNKVSKKGEEIYDKLMLLLKDEERELFMKFADSQFDVTGESSEMYFKSGLKLGARLVFDLLYGN